MKSSSVSDKSIDLRCIRCGKKTISITHEYIKQLFLTCPGWIKVLNYGYHAKCCKGEI